MESTSSIAQGSFLFLPDDFSLSKLRKSRKRKFDRGNESKWETAFNKIWNAINQEINTINEQLCSSVIDDVIKHMKKIQCSFKLNETDIPCEILLTGTNLSDHKLLFSNFIQDIKREITPYVALLWSWNCRNIKNTVQNFVSQIIGIRERFDKDDDIDDDDDDDEEDEDDMDNSINNGSQNHNGKSRSRHNNNFLMSQYNFSTLVSWYENQCKVNKKAVIIIIPDFEGFSPALLGEFILLLSSYSSTVPFILVLGVATTPVAVYQNLPRKVLSQLVIQLFRSEPSPSILSKVTENVLLSEKTPFRLGNKCMTFLTDIFLFHSFSVDGFLQGYKYCLMEHFFKRNHFSLCCPRDDVDDVAKELREEELENIRKLPSFIKLVEESPKDDRKSLLLNSNFTRNKSAHFVKDLMDYTQMFQTTLKMLYILTSDLPKKPLGRSMREYYSKAVSSNVCETDDYKECMKLVGMQSQNELVTKLNEIMKVLESIREKLLSKKTENIQIISTKLTEYVNLFSKIQNGTENAAEMESFEQVRKNCLEYIHENILMKYLKPPIELPLHEIIYFDNLSAVRRRLSGSPRGAIYLALSNPQCYLNCSCCALPSCEMVLPALPDLSIAYKTHLECNKMINMYDWLQSFTAVVKQNDAENDAEIDRELQARFTRAVSELQFLGFIKPNRAKTDHVSRLTWGNC